MSANQFGQQISDPANPGMEPITPTGASLRETAQSAGQQLKQKTAEATDQLKQKGSETLQQVREQAEEMATRRKDHLLDRLGHCSTASRRAAEQLRQDNDPVLADYAEAFAGRIERGANYLRNRDYQSMFRDTEDFARRHPEVVFGGLFIAGLALARFLKSSSARERWDTDRDRHSALENEPWGGAGGMTHQEYSDMPSTHSADYPGAVAAEPKVATAPGTQFTG